MNLRASITPTNDSGAVSTAYIDDVSFRKANPQKWGKNLLINGGFEDYALEYSVENWDIPKEGLALLQDAQNGNKSVQLDGTTMLSDDIALEKNTEYLFSGWIKNTSATTAEISLGDIATLSSTKMENGSTLRRHLTVKSRQRFKQCSKPREVQRSLMDFT